MELTTHLVKMKDFYNEIKILYPLWDVQPNLEKLNNPKTIMIIIHSTITITHSSLGPWDEKHTLQNSWNVCSNNQLIKMRYLRETKKYK